MNNTTRKLNTLSTLYFMLAVLWIPASFILSAEFFRCGPDAKPLLRAIISLTEVILLVGSLLLATCIAVTGHAIRKHRWRPFCLVVSVLLCPGFPVGTALGIFSLITLNKPKVKKLFSHNQTPGDLGA